MSMAPNNPFDTPNDGNQYPNQQAPPPKGSNTWLWVFGILGAIGIVGMMVCCGGMYFAYQQGTQFVGEELKNQLAGNPTIEENIGEIQTVSMNFSDLVAEVQKHQEEGREGPPPQLLYDIEGTKGKGKILLRQDPATGQPVPSELVMEDGTRHEIDIEGGLFQPDFDPEDIDLGEAAELEEVPELAPAP